MVDGVTTPESWLMETPRLAMALNWWGVAPLANGEIGGRSGTVSLMEALLVVMPVPKRRLLSADIWLMTTHGYRRRHSTDFIGFFIGAYRYSCFVASAYGYCRILSAHDSAGRCSCCFSAIFLISCQSMSISSGLFRRRFDGSRYSFSTD